MTGKKVRIIDGESDGTLFYTADMKLLIGKIATVIEETKEDVRLDIGDDGWGWLREWVQPI